MAPSPKVLAVQLNLPDVDQVFPDFLATIDNLHMAVARHLEVDEVQIQLRRTIMLSMSIFRREEEAMELTRDRMALSHRTTHQKFLRALSAIQARLLAEGVSIGLAQDMKRDLVDWIGEHHMLMDAALGRHIKAMVERSLDRISHLDS